MSTDDALQRSRALGPRIEAMRNEATALRTKNLDTGKARMTELGDERDRIVRERHGLQESLKTAERQATGYAAEAQRRAEALASNEKLIAEAERAGNLQQADELREDMLQTRTIHSILQGKAEQLARDTEELRDQAASVSRRIGEIEAERAASWDRVGRVEQEIDKLEDQADLWQQVRRKWSEIALDGDDIPRRAALELEIDALTAKAEGIEVDRSIIKTVVPDLPDRTPGIDDAPPPLPQSEPDVDNSASPLLTNDDVLGAETADAAAATGGGMTNGHEFSESGEATADAVAASSDQAVAEADQHAPESVTGDVGVGFESPAPLAAFADDAAYESSATYDPPDMSTDSTFEESFALEA